ncbi:hypothetical protein RVF83_00730 [Gordonia rubripertincta]|uniref:hypothetical protein n=1 Tax=Gordonia rubripertincta TaxID=36822 RepID=UPI0030FEF29F
MVTKTTSSWPTTTSSIWEPGTVTCPSEYGLVMGSATVIGVVPPRPSSAVIVTESNRADSGAPGAVAVMRACRAGL